MVRLPARVRRAIESGKLQEREEQWRRKENRGRPPRVNALDVARDYIILGMTAETVARLHRISAAHVHRLRAKVLYTSNHDMARSMRKMIGWPIEAADAKLKHYRPRTPADPIENRDKTEKAAS